MDSKLNVQEMNMMIEVVLITRMIRGEIANHHALFDPIKSIIPCN